MKEWKKIKEKAPGEDAIRMIYLKSFPPEFQEKVIHVVQKMFESPAENWDDIVKVGIMIPLHKKGPKDKLDNYRGICLLSMVSRILARILASRLRAWSEEHGALDDNQDGFRRYRSTADTTQVMVRLHEDNRRLKETGDLKRDNACLVDLTKAYPRVNRPLLWNILETYGFSGTFLQRLQDLHETTAYKVRSNKETSSEWTPQRGLREGCPSSPILFNIFHQVCMRGAGDRRVDNGVSITYLPGNPCMMQRRDQKKTRRER